MDTNTDPRLTAARIWRAEEEKKITRQRRVILSIFMLVTTLAVVLLSRGRLKTGTLILTGEMIMISVMVWIFSNQNSKSIKKFYDTLDQMPAPAPGECKPLHFVEE